MENYFHFIDLHDWPTDFQAAKIIQNELKLKIIQTDDFNENEIKCVAGIDVGFEQEGTITRAAVVLLAWPSLDMIERVVSRGPLFTQI